MRRLFQLTLTVTTFTLLLGCGKSNEAIAPKDIPPTPKPGTLPQGDSGGGKQKQPAEAVPPVKL